MDPPVSLPRDQIASPAAIAAALPPEEPPGTRVRSQRVRRGLEITCFRRGTHGKFIHVGLTDKDRIILTEIFNDVGIVDGLEVFQDL